MKQLAEYINESILSSTNAGRDRVLNEKISALGLDESKVTINPDGSIDYDGNISIRLERTPFSKIPLKFNKVNGNFFCEYCKLTTLENAPNIVTERFSCSNNKLKDLKGGPKEAHTYVCSYNRLTSLNGGPEKVTSFYCEHNKLKDLKGGPSEVPDEYFCYDNRLTALAGAPKTVGGIFVCSKNPTLTSLEGGPEVVNDSYGCYDNNLQSLKGAPKSVGNFNCYRCGLTTLEGAKGMSVAGSFNCSQNKLTSVIGLPHHIGKNLIIVYNNPPITSNEDKERLTKEANKYSDVKSIIFE